ncbi:hypothetical protein R1D69_25735, partial [Escherichia coli]|uniref:hypothetical protein n=1 Tax=Escherichia coli TaxID=562 RepID=UPI00244C49BE
IDHAERETTGVEGKAERLTWHKAWTAVSSGFSISYTSRSRISFLYEQNPGCFFIHSVSIFNLINFLLCVPFIDVDSDILPTLRINDFSDSLNFSVPLHNP